MVHNLKNAQFIDLLAYSTPGGHRVYGRYRSQADLPEITCGTDQARWEAIRHCLTAILGEADLHGVLEHFALGKSCKDHAAELGVHPGNACRRKRRDALRVKQKIMAAVAGPLPSCAHWQMARSVLASYCRNALFQAILAGLGDNSQLSVIDPRLAESVSAVQSFAVLVGTEWHSPSFPTAAEVWLYATDNFATLFSRKSPLFVRLRMDGAVRAWVLECVRPSDVKSGDYRRSA